MDDRAQELCEQGGRPGLSFPISPSLISHTVSVDVKHRERRRKKKKEKEKRKKEKRKKEKKKKNDRAQQLFEAWAVIPYPISFPVPNKPCGFCGRN